MVTRYTEVPGSSLAELDFAERARDITTTQGAAELIVVAANKHRTALWLVNDSPNNIYLAFGGRAAQLNVGIRLNANGGSLVIDKQSLYKGEIRGIATGANSVLGGEELESRYPF